MAAEPIAPGIAESTDPDLAGDHANWQVDVIRTYGGYITVQTAAQLFDVQEQRLQRAAVRGTLPARKVPASQAGDVGLRERWLVHAGAVARYLAGERAGGRQERRGRRAVRGAS